MEGFKGDPACGAKVGNDSVRLGPAFGGSVAVGGVTRFVGVDGPARLDASEPEGVGVGSAAKSGSVPVLVNIRFAIPAAGLRGLVEAKAPRVLDTEGNINGATGASV